LISDSVEDYKIIIYFSDMDYVDESSELHYSKKQSINIDH